jgi:DNA-3-methyladenine glycosylase II
MPDAFALEPRGPFSLREAAWFTDIFAPFGRAAGDAPERLELALHDVVVALRQDEDGVVRGELLGGEPAEDVAPRVERILSLDHDATGWAQLGERDAVLGARQRARPGFRPVLFPSAFEAAAWALLTQRTQTRQALKLKAAVTEAAGTPVAGRTAFPTPEAVLAASELPLPAVKAERLRGIAAAAVEGALDEGRLRALDHEQALAELRELPGIGPFSAELILIRGTGAADVAASSEPRVRAIAAEAYEDPALAEPAAFAAFAAERWRPWRSWAAFTLRAVDVGA